MLSADPLVARFAALHGIDGSLPHGDRYLSNSWFDLALGSLCRALRSQRGVNGCWLLRHAVGGARVIGRPFEPCATCLSIR